MEQYDVIIVGGGAAGLFARANLPPCRALLLEGGKETGRKLLITAGGMCNLTNTLDVQSFLKCYGSKEMRNFLLPALQNLTPDGLRLWFEKRGVVTVVRNDGKVFPQSFDARDIHDCLLSSSKIPIHCNEKVIDIETRERLFIVTSEQATYRAKSLIIAPGGKSYPRTGSDGSLYPVLKRLGHPIVSPKPALVGLIIKDWPYSALSGSSMQDVRVTAVHAGAQKVYHQGSGDLLFTHRGLSGPPILTVSGSVEGGDVITVAFIKDAQETIESLARAGSHQQVATLLREAGLTRTLALALLEAAHINAAEAWRAIDGTRRRALLTLIGAHPFTVERTMGFPSAMVTRGGVALSQVNRKSMESRIHRGLFFCGEVLDYDGESGGFNLQGAFSTALLAAQHVQEYLS